jgi:hypothetical protein
MWNRILNERDTQPGRKLNYTVSERGVQLTKLDSLLPSDINHEYGVFTTMSGQDLQFENHTIH